MFTRTITFILRNYRIWFPWQELAAVQLSTPGLTIMNHLTLLSPTHYLVSCLMLLTACSSVLHLVKKSSPQLIWWFQSMHYYCIFFRSKHAKASFTVCSGGGDYFLCIIEHILWNKHKAQTILLFCKFMEIFRNNLWNNWQMHLYAVNFIPLLGSLYMFWVFYTSIIRSTIFNCIYNRWYKPQYHLSYLLPAWPAGHAGSK